jgi:hypothetical protein
MHATYVIEKNILYLVGSSGGKAENLEIARGDLKNVFLKGG